MPQERCIYCLFDKVPYDAGLRTVRCPACGNLLYIADFKSEKLKLDLAQKERDQAKRALEEAQKEKQQADERLLAALDRLESIDTAQAEQKDALSGLVSGLALSQENQRAMETLLHGLTEGQQAADGQRDVITALLQETMKSQASADQKLQLLQMLCGKIVNAQGSIMDQLGLQTEISESVKRLEMDIGERERLIMEFSRWNQSAHQEDIQRLSQIQDAAGQLLSTQQEMAQRVSSLAQSAQRREEELRQFHSQWQASEQSKKETLYNQATNDLLDKKFLEAGKKYEQVQVAGERSIDIYWRLILCHYGVEYLYSEAEGRYVPTFYYPDIEHAPEEMSIWKNLLRKLEESGNRTDYWERVTELKEILEAYRHIHLEEEKPYDVFISVKQSDARGHYTPDSDRASDLYDTLTGWGLKVFNSRRCMDKHAGIKYEPYILAALMSARVMIVVGTNRENMEARWVKNEWQRFQWLEKNEKKYNPNAQRRLLLCYLAGSMEPKDIPAGLNPDRQAVKEGFKTESNLQTVLKEVFPALGRDPAPETLEDVLQQMRAWLATQMYDSATDKYNQVIRQGKFADSPDLHVLALCAKHRVIGEDRLAQPEIDLRAEPLFDLARSAAKRKKDSAKVQQLEDLLRQNEQNRKRTEIKIVYRTGKGKTVRTESVSAPYPGEITVQYKPVDGYQAAGEKAAVVRLDQQGRATPATVEFICEKKRGLPWKIVLPAVVLVIAAVYFAVRALTGGGGTAPDPVLGNTAAPAVWADLNSDGSLDAADIAMMQDYLSREHANAELAYDLNGDGKVTLEDLAALENAVYSAMDAALVGDADGNGDVNIADIYRLQDYLDGKTKDINQDACDLTGDGRIDRDDLDSLNIYVASMQQNEE